MSLVHVAVLAHALAAAFSQQGTCNIEKLQPTAPVTLTTTCMDGLVSAVFEIYDIEQQTRDTLAKPLYHATWGHQTQCPCFYEGTFCRCCDDYHVADVATLTCCSTFKFDKYERSIKFKEGCTNNLYSIPVIAGGTICFAPYKMRNYLDVCVTVTDVRPMNQFTTVCFMQTLTWVKKWPFQTLRGCFTLDNDPMDIGPRKLRQLGLL